MAIDATFWVAVSFIIFFGALIYLKIPQKISEMLDKMISDIKNEIDESEKLRTEAKTLLDNSQKKLDTAQSVSNEILENAKKDADRLIIEMNDKFHKISDIKKNQEEQLAAGHHGVPLLVHDGKYFFGQDKFDEFLSFMMAKGMQKR